MLLVLWVIAGLLAAILVAIVVCTLTIRGEISYAGEHVNRVVHNTFDGLIGPGAPHLVSVITELRKLSDRR